MHLLHSPVLYNANLFYGIEPENVDELLRLLRGRVELFSKGEIITRSLNGLQGLCCMLSGNAIAFQYDYWGNRSILSGMPAGTLLMAGMLSQEEHVQLDLAATESSLVLFLDLAEYASCVIPAFLSSAINQFNINIVEQMARVNISLMEKDHMLQQRSLRKKLMVFLSGWAQKAGSWEFSIPLSRQELADYLYVDRCALSHELSRMEKDGLLAFHGNQFQLKSMVTGEKSD